MLITYIESNILTIMKTLKVLAAIVITPVVALAAIYFNAMQSYEGIEMFDFTHSTEADDKVLQSNVEKALAQKGLQTKFELLGGGTAHNGRFSSFMIKNADNTFITIGDTGKGKILYLNNVIGQKEMQAINAKGFGVYNQSNLVDPFVINDSTINPASQYLTIGSLYSNYPEITNISDKTIAVGIGCNTTANNCFNYYVLEPYSKRNIHFFLPDRSIFSFGGTMALLELTPKNNTIKN